MLERLKDNRLAIFLLLLLILTVIIGISYAYWRLTFIQNDTNKLATSCFDISFVEETEAIQLNDMYPMSTAEGKTLTPYVFTVTNNCDEPANFQVNLEVLNTSKIYDNYIAAMINEENPKTLVDYDATIPTLASEASDAYILDSGYLKSKETKKYELRLWLDNKTPPDENSINSIFEGKVTLTATYTTSLPLNDYDSCVANYGEDSIQCQIIASVDTTGKCAEVTPNGNVRIGKELEGLEITSLRDLYDNIDAFYAALTETKDGYVCSAPDEYGNSYYYRGIPQNNWVKFAGFYWRIIRINGDGTIRLIYNGNADTIDSLDAETKAKVLSNGYNDSLTNYTTIGKSAFNDFATDNASIGYMYGKLNASSYYETHSNQNDSTIKKYLDNWYEENLLDTEFEEYLADNIFCNDRSLSFDEVLTVSGNSIYLNLGYGQEITMYRGSLDPRMNWLLKFATDIIEEEEDNFTDSDKQLAEILMPIMNKTNYSGPTLKCQQKNDQFSTSAVLKGNGRLDYPISLLTLDEQILAGEGFLKTQNNEHYFLYNGLSYYLLTPSNSTNIRSEMGENGDYQTEVTEPLDVRPVINLKADSLKSGDGTASNPYQVA